MRSKKEAEEGQEIKTFRFSRALGFLSLSAGGYLITLFPPSKLLLRLESGLASGKSPKRLTCICSS